MRVSKSGLVIAAVYVVLATASVIYGHSLSSADESTLLMQVPLLPALLLLLPLGLSGWVADAPWFISCSLLILANAIGYYAICWLLGILRPRTTLIIGLVTLVAVAFLSFWPVAR